ncbi:MAG TPA: zinc-ribbon domain-containing protein [Methylomirabilota bacterium]|nr:zinc-ribbon domain-containing protein [Methylomirabilota bacterium]
MLVQCPKCKTKYKVSDDVVKGATPAFRCSRCKHTFELELEMPEHSEPLIKESQSSDTPSIDTDEGRELSFTFPSQEKEQFQEPKELDDSATKNEHSNVASEDGDRWLMNVSAGKKEEPFTIAEFQETAQEKKIAALPKRSPEENPANNVTPSPLPEPAGNVYAIEPYRDQRASTVPFLTLFGLFIIFFSFAMAYHQVHPQTSEDMVGKIPLVGASVLKNNHLRNGVLLQSLQASYQMIQGNREVFVVTGMALNQNPVVIREVRVAGQLYNQDGKEVEQQSIWIGNAISPKIVRGMTAQDISDLQRLKPLKTFEIPPGDSVAFTIVFLKPTKAAKDFRCEILSAEGEA